MESDNCNFLDGLDADSSKEIRRKIVDLILATDMSLHFESVSKFKLRRQAIGFNFLLEVEDLWYATELNADGARRE